MEQKKRAEHEKAIYSDEYFYRNDPKIDEDDYGDGDIPEIDIKPWEDDSH